MKGRRYSDFTHTHNINVLMQKYTKPQPPWKNKVDNRQGTILIIIIITIIIIIIIIKNHTSNIS